MIGLSGAPTRRRRRLSAAHPPQVDGLRSLTKSDSATGSRYEDSSKTGKYRKRSPDRRAYPGCTPVSTYPPAPLGYAISHVPINPHTAGQIPPLPWTNLSPPDTTADDDIVYAPRFHAGEPNKGLKSIWICVNDHAGGLPTYKLTGPYGTYWSIRNVASHINPFARDTRRRLPRAHPRARSSHASPSQEDANN